MTYRLENVQLRIKKLDTYSEIFLFSQQSLVCENHVVKLVSTPQLCSGTNPQKQKKNRGALAVLRSVVRVRACAVSCVLATTDVQQHLHGFALYSQNNEIPTLRRVTILQSVTRIRAMAASEKSHTDRPEDRTPR